MYLMSKDEEVLKYDIDNGIFHIINNTLMPYPLKNCIISYRENYDSIIRFLSSRILPLDRENAKRILNALG